jgi:hypothetical protein
MWISIWGSTTGKDYESIAMHFWLPIVRTESAETWLHSARVLFFSPAPMIAGEENEPTRIE